MAPAEDATFPGLHPQDDLIDGLVFEADDSNLTIADIRFDISRIAERANVLFPFISPGLSLDLFALTPQDTFDRLLRSPVSWVETGGRPQPSRELDLTATRRQALIDATWARRDRWQTARRILDLVETHDANVGDAPQLLRGYAEQNLGQFYRDPKWGQVDARFWLELGLAADHVDFIGFVRQYVSAHPGTKGATEALFLLDRFVESNRNVLDTLLATDPSRDLEATRGRSAEAYALAVQLKRHYGELLKARGLHSERDVSLAYIKVRLALLEGIVRTTPAGYRADDARVLIGSIAWRLENAEAALSAWCAIDPEPEDVDTETAADLLKVLRSPPESAACSSRSLRDDQMDAIDRVLQRERVRQWEFQYERLATFGHTLDKF